MDSSSMGKLTNAFYLLTGVAMTERQAQYFLELYELANSHAEAIVETQPSVDATYWAFGKFYAACAKHLAWDKECEWCQQETAKQRASLTDQEKS